MTLNQLRWLPSLRSLSDEQQEVINESLAGNSLIYGPAGSGKSVVTLYRAKTLRDQGKTIKIIVFTNVLVNFIRAAVQEVGLPPDTVVTIYQFIYWLHRKLIGMPPDYGGDEKYSLWTDALISYLEANPGQAPHYDNLLVDEAQDLKPNVARLLRLLSKNILVAGDTSQSLYTDFGNLGDFSQNWRPFSREARLLRNWTLANPHEANGPLG